MTRRIALTFLALLTVLLLLAVVPLGWLLTDREQTSFNSGQLADTSALASSAEEHLADHKPDTPMRQLLRTAQQRGDCAAVYDAHGAVLAGTACGSAPDPRLPAMVAATLVDQRTRTDRADGRMVVVLPIGDTEDAVGAAVLVRSLDPLSDRVWAVCGWLALVAVVGLLAGTLVSIRLARWVGRPLLALDAVAQRLGEGALDVRAATGGVAGAGAAPLEVRRLAATFNVMAARNEALIHGHRSVIADVSHQLRTPLAALRLRLDLLADENDAPGDEPGELAGAQEEIARLSRLVDGLLAVARAESTVSVPRPVRVDLVVAERVASWRPVADERGVRLTACSPPDGPTALLGPEDLEQMLDNLLANALDAAPDGSRVRVEVGTGTGPGTGTAPGAAVGDASPGTGTVLLRVVDDGPGMTARDQESAFRRFGIPHPRGTGLGLAIVHSLVTANGGTARLGDTPGGGLTVVLELPRA